MTRNTKGFIFYIIKWTLGMSGRMRDYFGSIRNETLKKGHEGLERRREEESGKIRKQEIFLLSNQCFSGSYREKYRIEI